MNNNIELHLKNEQIIMVDSVARDVFCLYADDLELISEIMELGRDGDLVGYYAYVPNEEVVNPESSKFIGMSATWNDDEDAFYCVFSFAQKSEMEILQERLAALEEELRQESEYAEAGHIMLGEEIEP